MAQCKIKVKHTLLASLIIFVTGCVTPQYNYTPQFTQISEPLIDSVNTVFVGDEMLRQGQYTPHDAIYLQDNIKINWAYTLLEGYYLKQGEDNISEFYEPHKGEQGGGVEKAVLADQWKSIQAYKQKSKLCVVTIFNVASCKNSNQFKRTDKLVVTNDNFQQTLIYSGRVGSKIKISYREFSNNYARPAFNNDVEYDLSDSNIIGYKGSKLEIIEATNEYVKYRTIKNFNHAAL